ncbi:HNH endonuclease [Moraxella nasovis]|uniref:HNH endonuclease n=1 Tax=Moraxella nasovis TaxID=2904121 RepID=UPI0035CCF878
MCPRLSAKPKLKQNWVKGRGGRLRETILVRDRCTCQHCGLIGGQLELDYIVDVARGGSDGITICRFYVELAIRPKFTPNHNKKIIGGGNFLKP